MKPWFELTDDEVWAVLVAHGQDPDLPPRGVSHGDPPPGLRNWVCEVDGHEDPDLVGSCIHCGTDLP